jgi:ankyrin repeat protein
MNYEELQQSIEENLPIPDRDTLWQAIEEDTLNQYSLQEIQTAMLEKVAASGENLYHWCAKKGTLERIPPELLTEENLLIEDKDGWNSFHHAAAQGPLSQIPKELLTEKTLLKEEPIFESHCVHLAAESGQLDLLPSEILTEKILTETYAQFGENCLHIAAENGNLHQIPRSLLSAQNLIKEEMMFKTPFHYICEKDNFEAIPPLSRQTLKSLEKHFKENPGSYPRDVEKILEYLQNQLHIQNTKLIQKSLTQDHGPIF